MLQATRHPVTKVKQNAFAISRCADFILLPGEPVTDALPTSYLPYQYCPESDEYYMVNTPLAACRAPFLYMAQYDCATHVVRLPRRAARHHAARCRNLVLIFSIGRCGSTLLTRLLAALGYFCISESDVFTQLPRIACAQVRSAVILETTAMFATYSGSAVSDLAIKMRAQCSASVADIHKALPDAKYVFVTRGLRPWLVSFMRTLEIEDRYLVEILRDFVSALVFLRERAFSYSLLRYEEFHGAAQALLPVFGRSSAENEAFMRVAPQILARDAQEGVPLLQRDTDAVLAQRCERFLETWQAMRPARDIAALGLDM